MDELTQRYAEILKRILREHAALRPSVGEIVTEAVFDDAQGHYELIDSGWNGRRRIHGTLLHVDLRDGKFWIQYDGLEGGITPELLDAGVPREHIVLAFHPPSKRGHTGFAVG